MSRSNLAYTFLVFCAFCFLFSYNSYRLLAFLPILCVVFGACVWPWIKANGGWQLPKAAITLLSCVTLAALLGFLFSDYPAEVGERLIKLLPLFVSAVLLLGFAGVNAEIQTGLADWIKNSLFGLFSALTVIFFADFALGWPLYTAFRPDFEATAAVVLPQLNRFVIIPLIAFVMIMLVDLPRLQKIITAAIMTALFLVTESQSVQMTLILLLIFWAVWPFLKRWALWLFGAGVSVFTLGFPYLAIWMFENRPESMGVLGTKGAGFNRLEIWSGLSQLALQRPFFGYGLEATRHLDLPIEHLYWKHDTILHPHNYALQLWVEFGLFGVILFLGGFLYMLSRLQKCALDIQHKALSLMIILLGINLTAYGLWQGWWLGLSILAVFFFILLFRAKALPSRS